MESRIHQAPPVYIRPKKRRKLSKKWFLLIPILLGIGYVTLFLLVVPERSQHHFFNIGDRPMVIANRGGAALAPENTLFAINHAFAIGADAVKVDVRLSADGHLVVIHDETVNRTTDGAGGVHEFTLAQLKELDAAHTFRDARGHYSYRGHDIRIPTVEEVFQRFKEQRISVELKEAAAADERDRAVVEELMTTQLWALIEQYDMHEKVLVSSFSTTMLEQFAELAQGSVALSASSAETQRFVFYHKVFLKRLYRPQADALQLPEQVGVFQTYDTRLLEGAERLNMYVQYRTINDEAQMRKLLQLGADGLVTDRPDRLIRVINEMQADSL